MRAEFERGRGELQTRASPDPHVMTPAEEMEAAHELLRTKGAPKVREVDLERMTSVEYEAARPALRAALIAGTFVPKFYVGREPNDRGLTVAQIEKQFMPTPPKPKPLVREQDVERALNFGTAEEKAEAHRACIEGRVVAKTTPRSRFDELQKIHLAGPRAEALDEILHPAPAPPTIDELLADLEEPK